MANPKSRDLITNYFKPTELNPSQRPRQTKMNAEIDDDEKITDLLDRSKRQKIEQEPEVEPKTLLAEIDENVPVVNLDSSLESTCSREEAKAANNDKELYIEADNSEALFYQVKEKYVRPYPEHEQPAIQELLAKMNETDVRMFKFINDSGLYSDESILGMLDLEKRIIKQNKRNKNGKMKLTKITEEERAQLEPEDIVFARWIVQDRVQAKVELQPPLGLGPASLLDIDSNAELI